MEFWYQAVPAWLQAIGSVLAIGLAIWIPWRQRQLSSLEDLGEKARFASSVIDLIISVPTRLERLGLEMRDRPISPGEEYGTWLKYERALNRDIFSVVLKLANEPLGSWPDMELGTAFAAYAAPIEWLKSATKDVEERGLSNEEYSGRIMILGQFASDAVDQLRRNVRHVADCAGRHIYRAEEAKLPLRYSDEGTGWEMWIHPMSNLDPTSIEPEVVDAMIKKESDLAERKRRTVRGRLERGRRWLLRRLPRRQKRRYRGIHLKKAP